MAINKRKTPEFSASSMADIAFLLLIFFLVVTTMNVDTGITRVLPPMEDVPDEQIDIKQRNLLLVFVNRTDQLLVGGEPMEITQLREKTIEFIVNALNEEHMPEKEMTKIDIIGEYPVSQGVVSLQNDRGTSYDMYIQVQNELTRAFNDIRDAVAIEKFGRKFTELDEERQKAIQAAVPLKISEAEPRNIDGGR